MPCNSEHMEPTIRERQHRLSAQLLEFVYDKLGKPVSQSLRNDAKSLYGGEPYMRALCSAIKGMDADQMSAIVYNGRDPMSRKLADWWDEHQREDQKRAEEEANKAKSFDACLELAKQCDKNGYGISSIADRIAEVTGKYVDFESSMHVFEFDDGVIILSGIDGIVAYKGKNVA